MDSTHAAVGIGAGGSVGVLTGLIAGTWHLDPNLSADWAMAAVGVAGFAGGWVTWFIRWKWPSAPPLPGDTLTIAGPVTATVTETGAAAVPVQPAAAPPPADPPMVRPAAPPTLVGVAGEPLHQQA